MPRLFIVLFASLITGCSNLPSMFTEPMARAPTLQQASSSPGEHLGQRIRWSGVFLTQSTVQGDTWLELVTDPYSPNHLRFFVQLPATRLDDLAPGRELTVVGELTEPVRQVMDDQTKQFPAVAVGDTAQLLWHAKPPIRGALVDPIHDAYTSHDNHPWYRCRVLPGRLLHCQ